MEILRIFDTSRPIIMEYRAELIVGFTILDECPVAPFAWLTSFALAAPTSLTLRVTIL
jgi:hypothetical protein